ncbi:MAG TPA: sigma-70 family RNA polymerase sigma factor [Tepidisphaeraceae bacterium]|jgi:RNA polymerase sigma-70 factor (ECF subfamily)|nr:sigma-70 family RNA polymerase sigma factor [Tepidisphaeraceae bacterium]
MMKGRTDLMTAEEAAAARRDFDSFVAARRSQWVRTAAGILRDPADAEDVVQDTLLSAWRRWESASLRNPEGYVSRAVTLNALKRRARRKRDAPLDLAGELIDGRPREPGPEMNPLELERAIAKLSPSQQAVIRTKFYVGMTFKQIGRSLSISSNTAASRCRYALGALRRILRDKS